MPRMSLKRSRERAERAGWVLYEEVKNENGGWVLKIATKTKRTKKLRK